MNGSHVQIALVVAAVFAVGASAISCGLVGSTTLEPFDQVKIAGLPELDYCEVRDNPGHYNGKVVKIKGRLSKFMHGLYFYDARCSVKSYEGLLDDHRTAVTFFDPKISELYNTIQGMIKPNVHGEPVDVIGIGRFTREYPTGHTDVISDRTSFHFELFSVELAR